MRNSAFVVFFVILLVVSLSYAVHPVQAMPYSREDIAVLNRGYTYLRGRNYDRAIAEYSTVLRVHPNSVNALVNRGLAHIGRRDYDRAIADFTAVLRVEPNSSHARNGLAYAEAARTRQLQQQRTQPAPAQTAQPVTQPAQTQTTQPVEPSLHRHKRPNLR